MPQAWGSVECSSLLPASFLVHENLLIKEGFCDGMVKSLVFLPLLSRNAINNSSIEKQNLASLSRSGYCDNVLLEHRLAMELAERGIIRNIYPVLIGDFVVDDSGGSYSDYFTSGCHPKLSNAVIVDSVEHALQDQLNRLCFGTPLLENQTVPVILDSIVNNQGCLIDGPYDTAFDPVIADVLQMVRQKRSVDELSYSTSRRWKDSKSTVKIKLSAPIDTMVSIVEPYVEL